MANHVYFTVNLECNDTHKLETEMNRLHSIIASKSSQGWNEYEVEKLPIYAIEYESDDWYSWGIENMGAKWVSVDEWTESFIGGHSAWSPVYPLVESLVKHLDQVCGCQVFAKFTYEDEFRNFVGKADVYSHRSIEGTEAITDITEYEGDDFIEVMEEWSGWKVGSEDFDWWDLTKAKNGDEYEPQEVMDEMVYCFFDDGKIEVRHD